MSVILPVRNGLPWLEGQLQALADQHGTDPWELIVADNGSTDETPAVVNAWASRYQHFQWIDAAAAPGASGARNAAVRAARGPLLAFCDADDLVQPGWLVSLEKALGEAAVVAGTFDFWSLNGRPKAPSVPAAMQQFGFLPAGLSANLGVRRDAFEEVGGFDETLAIGEDIDLCWRLQLGGFRFVIETGAVVLKREPPELGEVFRQAFAYGRCGPALYRRYRAEGARRDLAGAARSWLWLLLHLPRLLGPVSGRGQWIRAAGMRSGRLAGSVGQRAFFP